MSREDKNTKLQILKSFHTLFDHNGDHNGWQQSVHVVLATMHFDPVFFDIGSESEADQEGRS